MEAKELHAKIRADIDRTGRSILGIMPDDGEGPNLYFTYTIGHRERGQPEILVVGPDPREIAPILNKLGEDAEAMEAARQAMETGQPQPVDLGGPMRPRFYRCGHVAKETYTFQAGRFYGDDNYEVVQLVIPDHNGFFPEDQRCDPNFVRCGWVERSVQ